jgi:hypothetical protein
MEGLNRRNFIQKESMLTLIPGVLLLPAWTSGAPGFPRQHAVHPLHDAFRLVAGESCSKEMIYDRVPPE